MAKQSTAKVSLRDQQKRYTRQVVLDASVELFERQGYDATTIDDIAKLAGASRATIYSYFTGKEEIARELATQMWERANDFYVAFAKLPDWSSSTLRGWLEDVVAVWESDKTRTRIVSEARGEELRADHLAQHKRYVATLTADRDAWAPLTRAEASATALALILQLENYLYTCILAGYPIKRETMLSTLTDIWERTLPSRAGKAPAKRRSAPRTS